MTDCIECNLLRKTCDACALERARAIEYREHPQNRRVLLKQGAMDWDTEEETDQ
jgi:hypothetical protein